MKLFIILACLAVASNALSVHQHWANFKVNFNRSYSDSVEELQRFQIFSDNVRKINEHNAKYDAGETTYTMGINQFADLTEAEFRLLLGIDSKNVPEIEAEPHVFIENLTVADAMDWRSRGAVLGVKNQGQCGSCWAFSATGAVEGQNILHHKNKTPLSEQQLVDCATGAYGNSGCNGGLMNGAFNYIKANGIESESSYPYAGRAGSCRASAQKSVVKVTGYRSVGRSEAALQQAVASVGPISIGVSSAPLQLYSRGVIDRGCNNNVDHGVLAVGYGVEGNNAYWIIKNSWGAQWGESGYYRLKRNANLCGITTMASYPTV